MVSNTIVVNANSDTKLTTKDYVFNLNDDDTIQAKLTNKLNYGVSGEVIDLTIADKKYSVMTDDGGVANFYLNLSRGNYSLSFNHKANSIYGASSAKSTVETYDGVKVNIISSDATLFKGSYYEVKLYDENNNVFPNQTLYLKLGSKLYSNVTDEEGLASITINLNAGTYNINYYYLGNDIFVGCSNSSKLIVKPQIQTKLTVLAGSSFHKNSGVTYNIELRADNVLSGKEVIVKIGSKTYSQITDSNGIIHLDIDDLGERTYNVEYSFAGDKIYAPFKGSTTLSITSEIPYGYGYWVLYSNMYDLDLASLASQGTKHIFLHCYSVTAYGAGAVSSWANQANNYGIKVHFWMQVAYDGEWHGIANKDGSYNYDLINSKVNEARYYASISGISGVHFDYLRFGGTAYKFPTAAESINYFVATAVSAIKSVNPNCLVSAALMPEPDNMLYYDGQDYPTLTKYLDCVLPMVYKGNYHQNTAWIQSITKWFVDNSNGAQVWTGLQAYRSDDDVTRLLVSELTGDAQASLNGGGRGVVMFRWGVTNFINFNDLNVL